MASKCDPDVLKKFQKIILSNGIAETVSEVVADDAGLKGEGFTSLTQLVTVKFENAQVKPLNLFVKGHTQSESHSVMLEDMKAFQKETTFLIDYVAAAQEMCKRKRREGFVDFYPKCYYGDEKIIVLENLVLDKGYEMVSMEVRQDLEAARMAIETLAKHHAIAHVMVQERGGPEKFFEQFPNLDYEALDKPNFVAMWDPSFDISINAHAKILQKSGIPGADQAALKLKKFLGKGISLLMDDIKKETHPKLLVLCHGDYWNNNVMFLKDKETQRILHAVAIDLQLPRYNSLALDLSYFLFVSVQPTVRQEKLKELLELYKDTFNSVTEQFDHPVNLSYEELFREYRRKVGFGYWTGLTCAVGPAMTIYKKVDIGAIELKDWAPISGKLIDEWIDDNPDQIADVAKELITWVQEYEDLVLED